METFGPPAVALIKAPAFFRPSQSSSACPQQGRVIVTDHHEYNEKRPHQGRWCFGKTPMQTLLDATPLAKEKIMAA